MRRIALIVSSLLLAACGGRSVPVEIQLLRQTCPAETSKDVLEQVSHLEFRISGEGIDEPIHVIADVAAGEMEMPEIPLGEPGQPVTRLIEVIAHYMSADGPPTARGSAVVQLSGDDTSMKKVPIFVRDVDGFGFTASAENPESCTQMRRARAGHTATPLADGRVLIVGGAEYDDLGRNIHGSAELFDPKTGEFTLLEGESGPQFPRVFHTATRLRGRPGEDPGAGKVLIAGGEMDNPDSGRKDAIRVAEIFDPNLDTFSVVFANGGRTRHTATLTRSGHVLLVGGYTDPNAGSSGQHPSPSATTEFYDPAQNAFVLGPDLPEPKAEHCAAAVSEDKVIVLVGGKTKDPTGVVPSAMIHFLKEKDDGTGFQALSNEVELAVPRYGMGCGTFRRNGQEGVLIAGGFTQVDAFDSATDMVESFTVSPMGINSAPQLTSARGYLCAVQVDPGTVVFTGGYNSADLEGGANAERSGGSADLTIDPTNGKLNERRYMHACTRLDDGSVLITGGRWPELQGTQTTQSMRSAELYTPMIR